MQALADKVCAIVLLWKNVLYLSSLKPGSHLPQLGLPSWEIELLQQEHEQNVWEDESCCRGEALWSHWCSSANRRDVINFSKASLGTWDSSGSQLNSGSILNGYKRAVGCKNKFYVL